MVVRVSPDDVVLYANEAMASYLRLSKTDLTGSPLEALAERAYGEVAACFQRPEGGRRSTSLATDAEGRVFEVKVQSEGGVMDIVFDEVTTAESICRDLRSISGTSVDVLNEEELRTARTPERRFMTVSLARLNGVTHLAGHLDPMEIQLMVNSFVEEVSDAVLETGCTAYPVSGEAVAGLFGAPRYFADHPFRAILAACSQIEKTAKLTAGFSRQGKEMPPMSCGIWTGEIFVGTLGNSKTRHYSAIGQPVDFAAELCRLARPGEALVSDTTLKSLITCLPHGWQAIRAESQVEPDLGDFQWAGQGIEPLSSDLVKGIWLVGPGIETDTSRVEFYLEYLWSLRISEVEPPVPILRVVRPSGNGNGLELNEGNVVSSQFVQTLGKYKLVSVIGTGGMGKVWKALDRYGNVVAIKVLHAGETTSETQIKRFRREAEIMARLPHRNICRVLEMNEFDGIQYLVMEFVDGLTLSELLSEHLPAYLTGGRHVLPDIQQLIAAVRSEKSTRPADADDSQDGPRARTSRILPVEQALNVFLRVCDAVQFAHEHGVLHRDLKPGNILLREDGEPLVADFGLAKIESGGGASMSLSVSGHVVGTLENMAPEQAESSKDVDERADLYSLGTILYQMLTGHRHFDATGNIVTDAQALQTHEPVRLRSLNPKLDADLEIIVLKCLRNSPVQRYRSVAALKADLKHYIRGEAITARPVSAIELIRKLILRNRTVSVVIASSVLILASSSAFAFWKVTERMKAAEQSAEEANSQRRRAIESENLAKQASLEAQKNLALAQEQIKKTEQAERAAQDAKDLADKANSEKTNAEKETEDQIKAPQGLKEELAAQKDKTKDLQSKLEVQNADPGVMELQGATPPPPALDDAARNQAKSGRSTARTAFRHHLSQEELALYPRNPEIIISNINTGIEGATKALLAEPGFAPTWMMKGRLHLSCMELKPATDAFRMAFDVSENKESAGAKECKDLIEICNKLSLVSQLSNDRFVKGAQLLESRGSQEQGSQDDLGAAAILRYFKDKPIIKKFSMGPSPIGRTASPVEQALTLLMQENGAGRIVFNDPESGKDITISGIQNLANLAPLRGLSPTKIRIFGAVTIDHQSLAELPNLESLDLGGCLVSRFEPPFRRFHNIKTLSLRDTKIFDLSILSAMPTLESLDISNSLVVDLGQVALAPNLKSIDASNLALKNLIGLIHLPFLTKLTISPEKITDRALVPTLQQLTKLQFLRAPGDSENQKPGQFLQKLNTNKPAPAPQEPAKNP